ncbi:MAG: response regulator [Candidatus Desulfatibia sp.]|uniref:response regulator n=1 Tax=Candidatus Desulfatibia sp. TaxID=3101189 RepID=UPI002F300381
MNRYGLQNASLLAVDDEPVNLEILEEILEEDGYKNATYTPNPLEAVDLYRKNEYDLVLLDLMMPVLDGFGVMERFAEIKKENDVPVLVLTALRDMDTRLRALSSGANDFVTKPFNKMEVLARVNNLLGVRMAQRELKDHNLILEQKVRERTKDLHDTRLEIIKRLGIAAEFKDNETGLHITRMSFYSNIIGEAIGLNDAEAELLLHTAPMHDIGKIGIEDRILRKPGKLDEDEWKIMKTHSEIGLDILGKHDSELLEMAGTVALTHHEKWNGNGYPKGISKDKIPHSTGKCTT